MIKAIAPLGLLALLPLTDAALAKTCPSGQIYRVSLGVCASKAANLKFYHPGVNHVAKIAKSTDEPADKNADAAPDSELALLRPSQRPASAADPAPAYADPPVDVTPAPFAPSETSSPFGGLPSASSFR